MPAHAHWYIYFPIGLYLYHEPYFFENQAGLDDQISLN